MDFAVLIDLPVEIEVGTNLDGKISTRPCPTGIKDNHR